MYRIPLKINKPPPLLQHRHARLGRVYFRTCAKCLKYKPYRPLAVGVSVGMANRTAAILEYYTWAFSMDHKYREQVVPHLL